MEKSTLQVLRALGITPNYRGYRQLVMAVQLVLEDEDRFYSLKNEVYLPVANELHCNKHTVERNIRTLILRVWKENKNRLDKVAGYTLTEPPSPGELIAIIASYVRLSCSVVKN